MSARLDSLAAIAAHRRAKHDVVEESPERVVTAASYQGTPTVTEVRWLKSPDMILAFSVLPLELPEHARAAVSLAIMQVNAKLACPGFVIKQMPTGPRVAFVGYAFADADATISTHALDALLSAIRGAAAVQLPRFAACVAQASDAPGARDLPGMRRVNPRLTKPEMEALQRAIAEDAPSFVPRTGNAMLAVLEQALCPKTTFFEIISPAPLPARTLYLARAADGRVHVLSGRPDSLSAVVELDPPADADETALAHLTSILTA